MRDRHSNVALLNCWKMSSKMTNSRFFFSWILFVRKSSWSFKVKRPWKLSNGKYKPCTTERLIDTKKEAKLFCWKKIFSMVVGLRWQTRGSSTDSMVLQYVERTQRFWVRLPNHRPFWNAARPPKDLNFLGYTALFLSIILNIHFLCTETV